MIYDLHDKEDHQTALKHADHFEQYGDWRAKGIREVIFHGRMRFLQIRQSYPDLAGAHTKTALWWRFEGAEERTWYWEHYPHLAQIYAYAIRERFKHERSPTTSG